MKNFYIKNKEKFYKKLFLYKSILYRNTRFIYDYPDNDLVPIVNALNIKNRYNRLTYIYDYCCGTLDEYYADKNYCDFCNNKCVRQQDPNCKFINGCCRLCIYQDSKGCKTSNLTCKLYYCSAIEDNYKTLKYEDFKILKLLSFRQRLISKDNFFTNRESFIKDLYFGSLVVFAIREAFRLIKNFAILKRKKQAI